MQKFDFVVLGGGISGLSFAKRVADHGRSVCVLEKEETFGGLSRSLVFNGYYLDFCAHRFHTKNKVLLNEILSLEGLTMKRHIKKSRIYMFGKYLKYPFELQNLLRAMPVYESLMCGADFLKNQLIKRFRKTTNNHSYKDWFIHFYGERLYKIMCYPYTAKIWHTDPGHISADWADQRFQGENMAKLMRQVLKKILKLDFSSYSLRDDSLAPDGGPFYYPLCGIQELPDALARVASKKGAQLHSSVEIINCDTQQKIVTYRKDGHDYKIGYTHLISTIPLHTFYALQDRRNGGVEKALKSIKYMDIIFVYLFMNIPQISNDHWLYFPDSDIIFNRAVEFSNWSEKMCPKGKTSICFDITSFEGDPIWQMKDEKIAERVINDAVKIKYIKRKDILSSNVIRVKYAYPFYDLDYKGNLDTIVRFLESDSVHLLGRTGIFKYNNADNSIEMGFALAEQILRGEKNQSIYKYKIKTISY